MICDSSTSTSPYLRATQARRNPLSVADLRVSKGSLSKLCHLSPVPGFLVLCWKKKEILWLNPLKNYIQPCSVRTSVSFCRERRKLLLQVSFCVSALFILESALKRNKNGQQLRTYHLITRRHSETAELISIVWFDPIKIVTMNISKHNIFFHYASIFILCNRQKNKYVTSSCPFWEYYCWLKHFEQHFESTLLLTEIF